MRDDGAIGVNTCSPGASCDAAGVLSCIEARSSTPRAKMGACFEEGVRMRDDGAIGVNTCSPGASCDAAGVLSCIEARSSTRRFDADVDITQGQRDAVLHAASRAPSAGAMMMYSIIDVREQATRDRLAVLCDNQPMIAKAPWALVFVVDYCKWIDLFEYAGCLDDAFARESGCVAVLCDNQPMIAKAPWALVFVVDYCKWIDLFEYAGCLDDAFARESGCVHRSHPGLGDFAIAAQDAVIAAQNAVIAAEAVGLGTCYIGDVVENAEAVRELLDLPPHTVPLSMLILGVPRKRHPATPHPTVNLVMSERYRRADAETLDAQVREMDAMFRPHANEAGARVRDIYTRKHTSSFMAEMSRSMELWLKNWVGEGW